MHLFLKKLLIFGFIFLTLVLLGVFLPATPRSKESLLFAKIDKDSLLKNVQGPRLILVGGSNLSFGIDSKMIQDTLKLNVINTGIQASIGLSYMLDNTLKFIKEGDVVVVVPEYDNFYGDFAFGSDVLIRTVMDVSPRDISILRLENWKNIFGSLPEFSFSKFKLTEYFYQNKKNEEIYKRKSFNEFGDATAHWNLEKKAFEPHSKFSDDFNYKIINRLLNFSKELKNIGAQVYLSFPGFQETSFKSNAAQIKLIELELKKAKFKLIGSPLRYKMPDSVMFNSPYHLIKEGIEYRTRLFINDLKSII